MNQQEQIKKKTINNNNYKYPRDNIGRLYMSRKEGWRGVASIEDSVTISIRRLITATRTKQVIRTSIQM